MLFQVLEYMRGLPFLVFTNTDLQLSLSFTHIVAITFTTLYMIYVVVYKLIKTDFTS